MNVTLEQIYALLGEQTMKIRLLEIKLEEQTKINIGLAKEKEQLVTQQVDGSKED
jgi:hypothetical protein